MDLPSPSTIVDAPIKTVSPTGAVQTATTTTTLSKPNNDAVSATQSTVTVTSTINGTQTTIQAPAAPPVEKSDFKTDCEKYPDNIGCSKYGNPAIPDVIPVTNVPLSLNVGSYSVGSCPAPQVMNLSHGSISMSNQPLCDLATSSKPLFIALSYLVAGFLVLSPIKG